MRQTTEWMRWLLASLFCALPAAAQPAAGEAPAFGEIVDVRVINLEVVVTDDGEPVFGLGSEDFRLLVDGEEVPIEYFTEVRGGFAAADDEIGDVAAVPALAPGEAVGTRYLVFIDDFFALPTHRDRVLRDLAEQLPLLGADDRMAVVAFDGDRLEMLTSWTGSQAELERAFAAARSRKAYGLQRLAEERRFATLSRYDDRGGTSFASAGFRGSRRLALRAEEVHRAREIYGQVDRVVNAATSTLRGFAQPPGRKVMLLLSGGWPVSAYEWVTGAYAAGADGTFVPGVSDGLYDASYYDLLGMDEEIFRPLIDTANRLGYTLYPVDVKGLASRHGGAEFGSLEEAAFASGLDREREWVEEGALNHLARATGGRAFVDGARANALERTVEDTRSYYWLGFSPAWQEDDERHKVKVEVLPKGLEARTRTSFSDLSRQTELTMLVESAQLFDSPLPENRLAVSLGEPESTGSRKLIVPVKLEIPLDQIAFLPEQDGFTARLELRVAATDDRGDRAEIPVVPFELHGEASPAPGQTAIYETSLKLRRRPHRLLISLYDAASGNLLSQRVDFVL